MAPKQPIFRGNPEDWQESILRWGAPPELPAVTSHALACSTAVFYAAADWCEMFRAPSPYQIQSWAHSFDRSGAVSWMSVDLAERAVHDHFSTAITGHMLPGHVIQRAAVLKLEEA